MKNVKLIAIVLIIAALGGGFFAGMKYQQSQSQAGRSGNFQGARNGTFGQRGTGLSAGRQGYRPVSGDIISMDDKSITVKLQDGSSKIVLLTGTTVYNKSAVVAKSDLKTGEKVVVLGTDNSDGSVTASDVQLNPQAGVFGR